MPAFLSSIRVARPLGARPAVRRRAPSHLRKKPTRRLNVQNLEDRTVPAPLVYVDDDWAGTAPGADPDGGGPATAFGTDAFATIQAGVTAADVGGTVRVLPGLYNELVTVNKTLTLLGAQAGADARTGRVGAPESVVNGSGFNLTASNITVDGFVVQNSTGVFPGFGIILGAGTSGSQLLNNIIQDNIVGISLANTGATQARIQFNLIRNNNQPGPASGHGIYTDQFNAGGTLANVLIDSNSFVGNSGQGIGFSSTDATKPATGITISNNVFDANGRGLYAFNLTNSSIAGNTFQNSTDSATADIRLFEGVNGLTVSGNLVQNGAGRALRISNIGTGSPNATNVTFTANSVAGYTGPAGVFQLDPGQYTGPLNATGNWWGDITGPTTPANPGGAGQTLTDPDAVVDFQPWLVYAPDSDPVAAGLQFPTSFTVPAQTAGFTATNNNYRRLVNVIELLRNGQTATLNGTFDWTEANAAASWALGNDGVTATADDYSLAVPANLNGVTLTAAALGSARIQGPGDLAAVNLEGFLSFDGGDNQNWTISNLEIFDFDLGIGMFFGAGGTDAFNNTKILNNHIRVPADLNITVAPVDVNQNIGIHFSFGTNQTIQNNQIDMAGNGVSDGTNLSSTVGMQSNTSGGSVYDGLLIDGNVLRVLDAQSANPARILGIWENGHAHTSNITVSNNQFLNLAAGNNPALNFQRAFRVTSHSGPISTVTYTGNTVAGANIGFEWLEGSNFASNQPVRLTLNTIANSNTGVLIQSNGVANLFRNTILNSGTGGGVHVVTGQLAAAGPVTHAVEENVIAGGSGDGIRIDATASPVGAIFNNDLGGHAGLGINNLSASLVDAGGNFWGVTAAAAVAGEVSANVDYTPWLGGPDASGAPGFQGDFATLFVSAASPQTGPAGRIAEGVALVTPGGTVRVTAGTYAESVNVNKTVSILGAQDGVSPVPSRTAGGPQESVVQATGGIGFSISAPDVTVAGFSVTAGAGAGFGIAETGPLLGTTIRDNFVFGFTGGLAVAIAAGSSDFAITDNDIFNNYAGVYLANTASGGTVSGNRIRNHTGATFTDDGSGVVLEGTNPNITITGNEITGNRHGIFIWSGFGSDLTGTTVFNNSLVGITAGVKNTNTALLNASGNWWGTNTPTGVAAAAGTNVDYSPWLDSGVDLAPGNTGFQGNFGLVHVDDNGPQVGPAGRIQEGVDIVSAGAAVLAHAGTYAENVTINKTFTLRGEGPATVISPAGGTGIAVTGPASVTLQDLRVTGATSALNVTGGGQLNLLGLTLTGNTSGGTVTNLTFVNLATAPSVVDDTVIVTPTQFAVQGQDAVGYANVFILNVTTGDGNDTVVVTPSPTTQINVNGGPGDDTLFVNQNGLGVTIIPDQVFVPGRQTVGYMNVEHVIAPPAVLIGGDLLIGGTSANDTVKVTMNTARTNLIVTLNGQVVGTFPLAAVTGRIVVHTNEGNDLVQIAAIVPVDAEVHGEEGNDRLFGGRGNDLLDGGAGNDSAVGGAGNDTVAGGGGRDTLIGSAGTDTAVGPDAAALWRITGAGFGTVNTTSPFRSVEALTGGTGDDTFRFGVRGSVAGRVDGGAGVDTLDYGRLTKDVRANLVVGTATATGGVANIENVTGGAGNDILVGDAQANRLVSNAGRDILIGGGGADSLTGGFGQDVLVAGSTDHDGSNPALENLMTEWKRAVAY
ncbi:MAG TPA: right-handed parallel beta-helix repeat-containing protein, partial [Gemmataceae bacterium]|nr:right-handed parallel beta-helix repeat-containing protein [Gemmataceae bacterium]